ncbi:MAG: hypothetical protein HY736_11485 [Verrucomicrobia bacterium]|nr:hypothetical protein [Verrucomicrobiota bacterium]
MKSLGFVLTSILVLQGALATEPVLTPDWSKFSPQPAGVAGVRVVKISSGGTLHRFFDTSPFSPSGRYLALFRFPREDRSPRPGETGKVILVDLLSGEERVVAESRGYELQLGANVQWGATDAELYFNDVDPGTWTAFAVQLNPLTGASRRLGGTVFMVSPDGRQLASYNLIVSRRAQVGYGVLVPEEAMPPRHVGPVGSDGVDLTDVATGVSRRIVTIREIYERSQPSIAIPNPDDFEYYCFQVKWNPQGTRLLATVQWSLRANRNSAGSAAGGGRRRAVITMRPDGSELRTAITPEQWAKGGHHINWMPDGKHLSMNLNIDGQPGLELISVRSDGTDLKVIFKPGSGHPSQHPGGRPFVITDAYPDEPVAAHDGTSPLRLLDLVRGTEQTVAKIFVSMTAGEFRVDPHPAWDRTGRFVVFNGFVDCTRNVFIADLSALIGK